MRSKMSCTGRTRAPNSELERISRETPSAGSPSVASASSSLPHSPEHEPQAAASPENLCRPRRVWRPRL